MTHTLLVKTERMLPAAVMILGMLFAQNSGAAEEQIFGPRRYDVKERYGLDNRYRETVRAPGGPALIKIQNGSQPPDRPDFIDMSVNGKQLIGGEQFGYAYFACFITLGKENVIELNLRDQKPAGLNRPFLPPRFVFLSVLPAPRFFPEGVYGVRNWEALDEFISVVRKVQSADAQALAVRAADLRQPAAARVEALRRLGARKDRSVRDYLLFRYRDLWAVPADRAEAAIGLGELGDDQILPALLDGIIDHNETVRAGAARALSLYPEDATREGLTERLGRLNPLMRTAVLKTIVEAGWKPIRTMSDLSASPDGGTAAAAIELLGRMKDPKATDSLLSLIARGDERNLTAVIQAMGRSGDSRAVEPLLVIARDPDRRKGREAALGLALADLGDQRAEEIIRSMSGTVTTPADYFALSDAYRKLTGRELAQPGQ